MSWFLGIVLVLGVMILVHEWGHFVMARIFKVRVDVFSIGFGPRLFGWKRGATDYRLSALPLGGYVRMAGQDLAEIDSGEKAPTGAPDELMSKPRWQRALISFAGPLVNLIFPIFLLTAFYATKGEPYPEYFDQPLTVIGLAEKATPQVTPLRVGDRVLSIDNIQNPTWEQAERAISEAPAGSRLAVELENKDGRRKAELTIPSQETDLGLLLGYAPIQPIVDEATQGYPADKAGVKKGDRILTVNGQSITLWGQFVDVVRSSNGSPVVLEVQRAAGGNARLTITPQKEPTQRGDFAWVIGVGPVENLLYKRMAVSQAASIASIKTYDAIAGTLGIVKKLLSGQVSIKQLQGPVGISSEAAKAVKRGGAWVISLMVLISVNLGILNLLPIPILDGGNILLLAIEGGLRRDLSMTFKERYIQVGLVFLLVLFAIVMYHDVLRQIPSHS